MVISGTVVFLPLLSFLYIYIHGFLITANPTQSMYKSEWILGIFKIHNDTSRVEGTIKHIPLLTLQSIVAQLIL